MADSIAFVVITGMSGAGKSFAIKCLEDIGFFCVDNLPTTLIPTFADLIARAGQKFSRVALGVDVREGEYLPHLLDAIGELRARGHKVEILFLEASDEALVRRYHETRRRHPLGGEGHVHDAIRAERRRSPTCGRSPTASWIPRRSPYTSSRSCSATFTARPARGRAWPPRWYRSASGTAFPSTPISSSTCGSCRIRTSWRGSGRSTAVTRAFASSSSRTTSAATCSSDFKIFSASCSRRTSGK